MQRDVFFLLRMFIINKNCSQKGAQVQSHVADKKIKVSSWINPKWSNDHVNPFRPARFSFELELETSFLFFNWWKTADIQAHSAAPSAALRACRSAFLERNRENVCEPLDILTRFYECLLNAIDLLFLRNREHLLKIFE